MRKRVLVDMDGVLADFERAVLETFRERYPGRSYVSLDERTSFYVRDDYPEDARELLDAIYHAERFYGDLPLVSGAVEGFAGLSRQHDVYICTSPLLKNPFCISEKFEWVGKHLGEEWTKRTLVVKDKTLIRADYLIDDRPEVLGADKPSWQHILFDQPYNRHVFDRPRLTWEKWDEVL